MNYIENIFICLSAPLLIASLCTRGRGRRVMIFLLSGMAICLLSSYISSFFAVLLGMDNIEASVQISPITEEIMKLFPVLFYILIFEPESSDLSDCIMINAIGFATFENVCYLINNGAGNLLYLAIRGFSTGAMHVVCAGIVSLGILRLWKENLFKIAGTIALLVVAITYHGTYNIIVSQEGFVTIAGFLIPILTAVLIILFGKRLGITSVDQ